jgi:3-oxocholest-4-en-26-oyl-CoA dehydrogenase beta subunit
MQKALEMTVEYTALRQQFGKPIGSFQAVQHHAADMAIDVASTRLLAFEALAALEDDPAREKKVAIAKAAASRAVPEVTMLAQQLHGGHGFIEESDLYFFTLRGKDRSLAWGTEGECLAVIAATIEEPEEWLCEAAHRG